MHYRIILLVTAISVGHALEAEVQDYWQGYYGEVSLTAPQRTSNVGVNTTHRYKINNETPLGLSRRF